MYRSFGCRRVVFPFLMWILVGSLHACHFPVQGGSESFLLIDVGMMRSPSAGTTGILQTGQLSMQLVEIGLMDKKTVSQASAV